MRGSLLNLMCKDVRLVFHPMVLVALLLTPLVIVPNWPYVVIVLYICLCPFLNAINARERSDLAFTLMLPVSRAAIAGSLILSTAFFDLVCVALMFVFSLVRAAIGSPLMFVGLPPNLAFLGLSLMICGSFSIVFFPLYWRDPSKPGMPFLFASVVTVILMIAVEAIAYLPYAWAHAMAQPGFAELGMQLEVLGVGFIFFVLANAVATAIAVRLFKKVDC